MKIFQIGYAKNGMYITEEAFEKAKEGFAHKPVVLYEESKIKYTLEISALTDIILGVIRSVDYLDDDGGVFGTVDLFDKYTEDLNLRFGFRNYQVTLSDIDKETVNEFDLNAIFID